MLNEQFSGRCNEAGGHYGQKLNMVVVAQLVRASDCGSESRRFESGLPPKCIEQLSEIMIFALFAFII